MSERRLADATVAIIGLGLMGGSLGLSLKGRVARRIGVELDPERARDALAGGAVDEIATLSDAAALTDLVVLAMPVRSIIAAIPELATTMRSGAVLTDLGSTKVDVRAAMNLLPDHVAAIAGHPMCGSERSGFAAADAALFRGATWAISDTLRTTADARTLLLDLIAATGAQPIDVAADKHDAAVATASHLPYVLAQALVAAGQAADEEAAGLVSTLASTGFAGAARLASGDVVMWRDILGTNASNVHGAIQMLRCELDAIDAALGDEARLALLLQRGYMQNQH